MSEDSAGVSDPALAHLEVAVGERNLSANAMHIDPGDDRVSGARGRGEIDGQTNRDQVHGRGLRVRRCRAERDVGQRGQDSAVSEASRVQVALIDDEREIVWAIG